MNRNDYDKLIKLNEDFNVDFRTVQTTIQLNYAAHVLARHIELYLYCDF